MSKKFKRYTVTAALPYANGPLHIGHIAGAYLPADIYVSYLKLNGEDVAFICGSDEHGAAITIRAKKEGISPKEIIDKYHVMMKKAFEDFGIAFDIYSRTSNPVHHETASEIFKTMNDKGCFIEQTSKQYYDEEHKQFLADRYITGSCPNCANEKAYGDQCEKCGTSLNPLDLKNPVSTLSGKTPILKETKHWFLPLENYQDFLSKWILEEHKNDWKLNVYGQCKSWLDQGLQARAVTRDLEWGVKVPLANAEGKVLYVWFDAPIGYISATKEWATEKGVDWKPYWQNEDTKLVHFIGKDNIVFHCIVFPAILKGHGNFILPDNVPANEFLNLEGDKISTSRNWAVWLHEYMQEFSGKADVLRYVLCANAPETKDNDFSWKDFQAKNNNELVAVLGNFINRSLVLTQNYFENKVPQLTSISEYDKDCCRELINITNKIGSSIERYRFREALSEVMNMARLGNKYLADNEPWKVIKTEPERVKSIMNIALQIAANLAIVMEPFLPETSMKVRNMLGMKSTKWKQAGSSSILQAGHQLGISALLFDKIEDAVINKQLEKLIGSKQQNEILSSGANKEVVIKPNISFDDFTKLDIRIVSIIEAEKVKGTKKLLKLKVDTGKEIRTVVSGIAEYYKPEDVIGKKVTLLSNLAPREIKGIQSQGMILLAEDPASGKMSFVSPIDEIMSGAEVK
jgi:methionyl-tRNA synthetase